MGFRDRLETNADGDQFVFTVEMQRYLDQAGLPVTVEALNEQGGMPKQQSNKPAKANPAAMPDVIQIDPETGKYIGRIKWFNDSKGYGFLMRSEQEEIFFHQSNSLVDPRNLAEYQWVLYDVEERGNKTEATEIEPYAGTAPA